MLHGRYSLLEVLGRGRSGRVQRGFDHVLQREVAVKTLADTEEARWEIQILGKLSHPHIVEFFDAIIEKGKIRLVMELGAGGTVRQKRLSLQDLVLVGLEAGQALQYLHEHGLVHCDVKPSHLVFARDGKIKLVDFGTAAPIGAPIRGGTAKYMAPELRRGAPAHPRMDVFALAKTLLVLAAENKIRLPARLKQALKAAAASEPEKRIQNIEDFMQALMSSGSPTSSPGEVSLSLLRGGAAALFTVGFFAWGPNSQVYPAVFSWLLAPGIVGLSALYSPLLAAVSLTVVVLPCLL